LQKSVALAKSTDAKSLPGWCGGAAVDH
jgi:hypothetical protein